MQKLLLILLLTALPVISFGQVLVPYLGKNGQYGYADTKGAVIVQPAISSLPDFLSLNNPSNRINKETSILRNGLTIEAAAYFPCQNDSYYRDNKPTNLFNLIWGITGNKLILVDLTTRKSVVYFSLPKSDTYKWFQEQTKINNAFYYYKPKFFKGVMPVWKAADSINFVDIHLNEIFPREFTAGGILDDQHFILAEGPSRYALGNKSGKILTPFIWSNITTTPNPDFFIVNMPFTYQNHKAGLIKADGKIILDTLYQSIEALETGRHLIVKSNGRYGVCNYDGKVMLPIDYHQIEQIRKSGFLKVSRDGKKWDILNHDLQAILDTPAEMISTPTGDKVICVIVENQGVKAYYDENLKHLFSDIRGQQTRVLNQSPLLFTRATADVIGALDAFLKPILPQEYTSIYWQEGYFEVRKKGAGYGFKDKDGKTVVPEIYNKVSIESLPSGKIFWGMDSSYFWTPYDSTGQLIAGGKKLWPNLNSYNFVRQNGSKYEGYLMVLADGTILPSNDSLICKHCSSEFNGSIPQLPTPDGGFIINFQIQNKKFYFNHQLQNLVQPGFEVFQPFKSNFEQIQLIKNTGLLPILKYKAAVIEESGIAGQAPAESSQTADRPMILFDELEPHVLTSTQNRLFKLFNITKFSTYYQDTPEFDAYEAGGIKNAKGEWVIAPKKGSYFIPISYYLAIEVPLNIGFSNNAIYPNPLKIHKINQPDTSSISINHIGAYYFKPGDRIKIRKADPTGTFLLSAYIDEKGNLITPFHVVNGPAILSNQNLITTISDDKAQQISQRIIDKNGNIVKTLGTSLVINPNSDVQPKTPEAYFIVEEFGGKLYLSDTNNDFKTTTKQGIIDSLGNWIIPVQYKGIKIQVPGRLFSAHDANWQLTLFDWKGNVIFQFKPGNADPKNPYPKIEPSTVQLSDGKTIVFNDWTTIVLTEDYKILKTFPFKYRFHTLVDGELFLKVQEKDNNLPFYVHVDSGRVFRE